MYKIRKTKNIANSFVKFKLDQILDTHSHLCTHNHTPKKKQNTNTSIGNTNPYKLYKVIPENKMKAYITRDTMIPIHIHNSSNIQVWNPCHLVQRFLTRNIRFTDGLE